MSIIAQEEEGFYLMRLNGSLMRKLLLLFSFVCFAIVSFSQASVDRKLTREYYLHKSHRQKTAGWVLLGSGAALVVTGGIIGSQGVDDPDEGLGQHFDQGVALFTTGVLTGLASVPFFIGSSRNVRNAAAISFKEQKMLVPQCNTIATKTVPAISIRFSL